MKRIRIRMLATVDQLQAGEEYNAEIDFAHALIAQGKAENTLKPWPAFEVPQVGPSETKPVEPQETKREPPDDEAIIKSINNAVRKGKKRLGNA